MTYFQYLVKEAATVNRIHWFGLVYKDSKQCVTKEILFDVRGVSLDDQFIYRRIYLLEEGWIIFK